MFKKKILITLILLSINNTYANELEEKSYLVKIDSKVHKNALNVISEDDIVFKEIIFSDWIPLSFVEENINPQILEQKENFFQNYDKKTIQKKIEQYIYTNLTKGIDFVKETKEQTREITENFNREVEVLKLSEAESELRNCTNWMPLENTIAEGESFTQKRNCDYDIIEKYRYSTDNQIILEKNILSLKNKEIERISTGTLQVAKYCKVEIKNMIPIGHISAALGNLSLQLTNGSDFVWGALTYNTRTDATFTNASIKTSSTYFHSGGYYFVSHSLKGYPSSTNYWLGANSSPNTYTINLNEGQALKSISMSDKPACPSASCRGIKTPYNIDLYDCENNLVKSYTITTNLSGAYGSVGTFIFN